MDVAQQEINGRTTLYFDITYKYGNSREKKIEKVLFKIFDGENEANEYKQPRLNFEEKKDPNPFEGKSFEFIEFKKKFPKIHAAIKAKITDQYKELGNGQLMANFDTMIENSIIGMSENYFKFFISQSIKEPDKVVSAKDMFEKMGIPVKIK